MIRWISLAVIVVTLTVAGTLTLLYEPAPEPKPSVPVGLLSPSPSEEPPPKVEVVGTPVYNFGMMPKHAKGAHTWMVKNIGQGPLHLWMEDSTCSCTVAKLQHTKGKEAGAKRTVVVPPGQSTPIEVTWDTKAWTDFAHSATLGTNDPETPSFTFAIRGKVVPPVAILPSETVSFPTMSDEESRSEKLIIFSPDRADLKLTKLSTSRPGLIVAHAAPMTLEEAKPHKVEAGYTVVVAVKPGMPVGPFREALIIETDDPREPEAKVTVVGKVTGPISAIPDRLRMPYVASRDGASGTVTLRVRGGRETHFQVAHKPEKVQVSIKQVDTTTVEGRYQLIVTVLPGTAAGPVNDQIVLRTDHPKASQVEIPVNIFISRSGAG